MHAHNPMSRKTVGVPAGLLEILQDFAVAVLRKQPPNIINFAVEYFEMKKTQQKENDDAESKEDIVPPFQFRRRQGVAAESYDPEKVDRFPRVIHKKTEEQRKRLASATKGILLFSCLDEEQMQDIIDAMFERKVEIGEKVITLGEDGDNFYVIEKGVYDIIVKKKNGIEEKVGQYDNSGSFGELALMYNTPRAATIQATTSGILWAMTREVFRSIVLKSAFKKRQMYEELLNQVPVLQSLSAYERMSIADALHTKVYKEGAKIISQGEEGDEMYFIEGGEVRITMKKSGSDEEIELTRIKKDGYFGELALLTKHPRAASVYAVTRTKLAILDVGSFERLLGPCLGILQRNIDNYENQLKSVFGCLDNVPELRH